MNLQKDLVSIIVPVYNAEHYIVDAINSVKSQTYENWELILVDDCSFDKSEEIIKEFQKKDSRIKFYKMKKNVGPASARNLGIDKSKGKYLCFLDSDDVWEKNKLKKQIDFMIEKKCAFSYHSYEFADKDCKPSGKKVVAKDILTYKEALKNNIISTITVMFDTKIIDKELLKMPNIKYVEDTATWWRILRKNYVAYGIPDVFSYYRRTKNTNSSNKMLTQKSLWYLYRNEEKLSFLKSVYYLSVKNINALVRRV